MAVRQDGLAHRGKRRDGRWIVAANRGVEFSGGTLATRTACYRGGDRREPENREQGTEINCGAFHS
jgi:hypothetical protein